MPHVSSPAVQHIPHQVLDQHGQTRLLIRGRGDFSPDVGDAIVCGQSTYHAEVDEF